MPLGPGTYDDLATLVREQAAALGVVVIVIEGTAGNGFSVQGPRALTVRLPELLRTVADQIERDTLEGTDDA